MTDKHIESARDPDLAGSFAALQRAARRARELAARTGTELIVQREGRIKRVPVPAEESTERD